VGVDVFEIARNNELFCGTAGPHKTACTLSIGIMGFEATSYSIKVRRACAAALRKPQPRPPPHAVRTRRARAQVFGVDEKYYKQTGHQQGEGKAGGEVTDAAPSLLCASGCEWCRAPPPEPAHPPRACLRAPSLAERIP